jgi:hypothetical protein
LSMGKILSLEAREERKRLQEGLFLAEKRAAEAFREDPTRSSQNSEVFRKAQMADEKVKAIKRRIKEFEGN